MFDIFNCLNFSTDSGFNGTILQNIFSKLQYLVSPKRFYETEKSMEFERAMKHHNYTYDTLMHSLMQPCDKMILQCSWLNRIRPCNDMFIVSRTTKGFCCSFNTKEHLRYIRIRDWHFYLASFHATNRHIELYSSDFEKLLENFQF